MQSRLDNLNTIVQENISGIRLGKAFVRSDYEINKFYTANDELTNITVKTSKIVSLISPFMLLTMNMGVVAALWFGVFR